MPEQLRCSAPRPDSSASTTNPPLTKSNKSTRKGRRPFSESSEGQPDRACPTVFSSWQAQPTNQPTGRGEEPGIFSLPLPFLLQTPRPESDASRRRGRRPLFFLAERQPFMGRWTCTGVVALVLLLSAAAHGRELPVKKSGHSFVYNHTLAKTLVEYASAVYMTDLTALYTWTCSRCNDQTQGFEMRSLIVDVENCLQAFVGVAHNLNSIVVAIRGTQENSVQNWIKDLIWKQLDLSYPNMPNAKVWIHDSKGNTTEQICDDSGEDSKCCRCVSMFSLSIQDHFTYLGVDMEADDWSTCRIIGAQSVQKFRKELTSSIIMTMHNVDVSIVDPSVQTDLNSFR
ncbi:hypothetical protein PVAP13_2KG571300 [Panicum virgatum]|uniref:Uncharacterized protein n=1 Tax=Panicum virgatum TaxID=38727 RepID=A0A8T0WW77_PANVG|nr:hypothetical protein PVAP13_2KG571300 [Panicum virgatum]